MTTDKRYGVLLVNTGTPDAPTPEAVKEYLAQFLMDDRIVPMNKALWWCILHCFILPKRKYASAEKYKKIWTDEGSTFALVHDRITTKLQEHFNASNYDVTVACGMSYGKPTVAQAFQKLQEAQVDSLVVLPLYPQSAYSTTGSVQDAVMREKKRLTWDIPTTVIDNYATHDGYIQAMAQAITRAGFGEMPGDRLIFSFHSIPLIDIQHGDSYAQQTATSCQLIADALELTPEQWTQGFQCQFDKGREWLHPFSRETLRSWACNPQGRVFVVCPNFVSDCLETFYDVGYELKPYYFEELSRNGFPHDEKDFVYIPCLNDSDVQIQILSDVVSARFAE